MPLRRKTPLILQSDEYECGYAALAMICAYHGLATTPSQLRRTCDKGGVLSAADIREVGQAVGLRCRAFKIPAELVRDSIAIPAILHWDRHHYVVLASAGRKFRVHDPAIGILHLSRHEFAARYSGVAISSVPERHFRKSNDASSGKRAIVEELLRLASRTSGTFVGAVCLSAVLLLTLLLSPLYVRVAADALGASSSSVSFLAALAVCFGAMSIFSAGTQLVRDYMMAHWGVDLGMQLGRYVMGRLMGAKLAYFSTRVPSEVVSRFYAIEAIRSRLSEGSVGATIDGAMAVLLLAAVVAIDTWLAGIVLVGMGAICVVRSGTYSNLRNWEATSVVLAAKERALTIENIHGIESIKALVVARQRFLNWGATLHESARANLEYRKRAICVSAANALIEGLCDVVAITAAIWFVMEQQISIGDMFAFSAYKGMLTGATIGLVGSIVDIRTTGVYVERLADFMDMATEDEVVSELTEYGRDDVLCKLELCGVWYRYGVGDWVLRGTDLSIDAGEFVVILGETGGGKSTLLKVLLGLFTPEMGEVRLNGKTADEQRMLALRRASSAILQNDVVFTGTFAENIALGYEKRDEERLRWAAEMASIHGEIVRRPLGYDTLVFDHGGISSGEKQRIVLARAFYRRPQLFVVDEGMAHLDDGTAGVVFGRLRQMGAACVMVTHDRRWATGADAVYEMVEGKLRRVGAAGG